MKTSGKIDTREFSKALREYGAATEKDEAEILNRAGRNVGFQAAKATKITTPARIRGDLRKNNLAVKILAARGAFKGIAVKARGAIVDKMVNARVRSARYIRVGWGVAIAAFGGRATRLNPRSQAAKGYGEKATARKLIATLGNNAPGADTIALPALQSALSIVAKDMASFAQKYLQKTARKFSAKGAK